MGGRTKPSKAHDLDELRHGHLGDERGELCVETFDLWEGVGG